ncbi:MAG: hypothetical protein CL561_10050 [Alphaproteobacteria bacterium]|nr:hypothetical protein [Alphaproteobacteria bacterium]|tara:strand:+ start:502 stop:1983 length:1482 start_codon:yes stop_codon:yes gene_type:complete
MNREESAQKTLDQYSYKYTALVQDYDRLRWHLLTASSGIVGRIKTVFFGAALFINQLRLDYLLSRPKLQQALTSQNGEELRYQQLAHAASYHPQFDLWDSLRLHGQKIRTFKAWEKARLQSDFSIAAAPLQKLLKMQFSRAHDAGYDPYQYALAEHSRGLRDSDVGQIMSDTYRSYIKLNTAKHKQSASTQVLSLPPVVLDKNTQQRIVTRLWADMGLDMARIDVRKGAHPACLGYHDDVVLSMVYDENNVLNSFLTALHEGGHALYRQNLPRSLAGQADGLIVGRDMDEAMALFWEHGVAHHPAFAEYLARVIGEETHGEVALNAAALHQSIATGGSDGLRISADVMHYPLHLMQRRAVMKTLVQNGGETEKLKHIFNAEAAGYIGAAAKYDDDGGGVLQDPHWFTGDLADFDNYFMGQHYALTLYQHMQPDHYAGDIKRGNFAPLAAWLNEHVYKHGAQYTSCELVEKAVGVKGAQAANGYRQHISQIIEL